MFDHALLGLNFMQETSLELPVIDNRSVKDYDVMTCTIGAL
jgi:hypothetical protein